MALVVFLIVAGVIGTLVDQAARRASEASRSRAEAEALARSSASLATDPHPLPGLVDQLRTTFGFDTVEIAREHDGVHTVVAAAGSAADGGTSTVLELAGSAPGDRHLLTVTGRPLTADDQRLLRVMSDQLAVAVEAERLAADAADASSLAEVDAVRTALLRAVSHDLRTPLSTIKAMISGLRDTAVAWTPEQMSEALAAVDEETDRLNRLVSNLLDASRLQSGSLAVAVRPTAVEEPVSAAIHSIGAPARAVSVAIPEDLPLVRADAALLERSLANVLANALRHNPEGEPVRLEAGVVGDDVHLRVVDRGPGIPAAQRAHVVAPFQRLGDQRTDDGVGLGLAIAVGFVEAMGGCAHVGRHAGRWVDGHDRPAPCHAGSRGGGMNRVLVVDDEPQIRRALSLNLRARGYAVLEAGTGEAALQAVATEHPDLVLLDLGLPKIDGFDVIEGLRGWTKVPIIVLTVREDERSKVRALDLGADDYVTKPFGMDELLARLRAVMRRAPDQGPELPEVRTRSFRLDLVAKRAFAGSRRRRQCR